MTLKYILITCFLIFYSWGAYSQEEIHPKNFQRLTKHLQAYKAEFHETQIQDNKVIGEGKGKLSINYPGRFRFKYTYGDSRGDEYIGNGEELIFYDELVNSARKFDYETYSYQQPLVMFLISENLSDIPFKLEHFKSDNIDIIKFAYPKDSDFNEFTSADMHFSEGILTKIVLWLERDQKVEYVLSDIRIGVNFEKDEFQYKSNTSIDFFD